MEITESIITKLFDTLSHSIDDNKRALDKSVDAQINSINYLKPKIDNIEKNSDSILNIVSKLKGKITIMISTVLTACTLLSIVYYISRFFVKT